MTARPRAPRRRRRQTTWHPGEEAAPRRETAVLPGSSHQLRRFAGRVGCRLIEPLLHPARNALPLQRLLEFAADELIFFAIRDGASALPQVDRAVIQQLLAGTPRLARTLIVRPVPGGDAQAFLADAEMLMEPIAAHGRGGDKTHRLVVLAQHLVGFAVPPRRDAERVRPSVRIALAFDADQHRRRGVLVRLRIAPGFMLSDP